MAKQPPQTKPIDASRDRSGGPFARPGVRWGVFDALAIAAVMLIGFGVFLNAFDGEFVYDDEEQIVNNRLVTTPGMVRRALTSDVWAFKTAMVGADGQAGTEREPAGSNYYRPAFVGLLIVQHRLFGLESTRPWHATNALMHALVCGMAYVLARRLGLGGAAAGAVSLIFAVHPAHVETVAWISGSPDLLLSIGVLGSMIGSTRLRDGLGGRGAWWAWPAVIAGYALAVTSKEMGILAWMPVSACALAGWDGDPTRRAWHGRSMVRAASVAVPGVVLAAVFWIIRGRIIGDAWQAAPGAANLESMILSVPAIAFFYLRQAFWPWEGLGALHAAGAWTSTATAMPTGGVGAAHPLRAVTSQTVGFWNFWLPLMVCVAMGLAMLWSAWRSRAGLIGLALIGAMLAPAFNIRVFPVEHIVRDRYLYLPLLGLLLMIAGPLEACVRSRGARASRTTGQTESARGLAGFVGSPAFGAGVLALVVVAAVGMAIKTVRYNEVWKTDLGLWESAVKSDPTSAHAFAQWGTYLSRKDRLEEALEAFNRAERISSMVLVRNGRAVVCLKLGDVRTQAGKTDEARALYTIAERDARLAWEALGGAKGTPDSSLAESYDQLGTALARLGRLRESAAVFGEASAIMPFVRAKFATKQGVALYKMNDSAGALRVMEAAREAAKTELNAESKLLLHRLGALYGEMRRGRDALDTFTEFLVYSRDWQSHDEVRNAREQVLKIFRDNNLPIP